MGGPVVTKLRHSANRMMQAAIVLDQKWGGRENRDFPRGLMAEELMEQLDMTRATAYRYVADYIVAKGIARRFWGAK